MACTGDVELERKGSVANVLLAYLQAQIQVLKVQDPEVRRGTLDSVHLMRIATRRLRSALATYRAVLDIDLVNHLREELKWLGMILGAQRDAEVMRQRLKNLIAMQPFELTLAPASRLIEEQLEADFRSARLAMLNALDEERYLRLLDDLAALHTSPPFTELAAVPAKRVIPDLVRKEWNRLRRTVRSSERISGGRDYALHDVRKSAKRLRYAAETATLVRYKQGRKLAAAAEEIQTILGDHHDCVVARDLLHRWEMQAQARGEKNSNFWRLEAIEKGNADRCDLRFQRAWKHFPSSSLKS